jgi:hypothetical protein
LAAVVLGNYLADLRDGVLDVDMAGLVSQQSKNNAEIEYSGYDWEVPVSWRSVVDAWAEFLPRPVMAWTDRDYDEVAKAWDGEGGECRVAAEKIAGVARQDG